ncbi:MAG: hypothetical protein ACOX6J_03500 [Oscillospiraceae bacterium]
MKKKITALILAAAIAIMAAGCGTSGESTSTSVESTAESSSVTTDTSEETSSSDTTTSFVTKDSITVSETYSSTADGEHAIDADGTDAEYSNISVTKTGDSSSEDADFYGDNAAIIAQNGATLTISEAVIETDGSHANAVFSYGEGTTVNISDSYIETTGNNSGGLMTTGGGTTIATNLTVVTYGNSSAAIRSDRGGGTVNVTGGSYSTYGVGSPVIYSTADITVTGATLTSDGSEGVVVEGSNSVELIDCTVTANNTELNSDNSDLYKAVMIYQSMSGDAAEGEATFTMNGGTFTNLNGDMFFVTNTTATINLTNVTFTGADGNFLTISAAGWGNSGSNGGDVTLNASDQVIEGDMYIDSISSLILNLSDGSSFTGAINTDGQEGDVTVTLDGGSVWTLTGDSYITSLDVVDGTIDLNGYTLYVNGVEYTA